MLNDDDKTNSQGDCVLASTRIHQRWLTLYAKHAMKLLRTLLA